MIFFSPHGRRDGLMDDRLWIDCLGYLGLIRLTIGFFGV